MERHGISCIKDIPGVGQNLQDHLTVNISCKIKNLDTFSELMTPLKMINNLYEYYFSKNGLMTYPASDIGVFFKTNQNISRPDAQIHFAPGAGKYNKNGAMKPSTGITASVCNLRPKSRGHLELTSSRADDSPKIVANYLSEPEDLKVMIDGVKRTREIFKTNVMKNLSATEILPGKNCITDKDIEEFIRNDALSVYHPVGTCKMGIGPECVVNNDLTVKGLQGLRVADASIFPEIISGNTNATCNVIGAKCADLILKS